MSSFYMQLLDIIYDKSFFINMLLSTRTGAFHHSTLSARSLDARFACSDNAERGL
jgi:hypothetical protein